MTEKRAEWFKRLAYDWRVWAGAAVFAAAALAAALLLFPGKASQEEGDRLVARVTVSGTQILAIDLYQGGLIECSAEFLEDEIEKKRSDLYFDLSSVGVQAVLRLKNDRQICVDHSACKGQACVKCGYIAELEQTIECEEDGLRVEIVEKTVL